MWDGLTCMQLVSGFPDLLKSKKAAPVKIEAPQQ